MAGEIVTPFDPTLFTREYWQTLVGPAYKALPSLRATVLRPDSVQGKVAHFAFVEPFTVTHTADTDAPARVNTGSDGFDLTLDQYPMGVQTLGRLGMLFTDPALPNEIAKNAAQACSDFESTLIKNVIVGLTELATVPADLQAISDPDAQGVRLLNAIAIALGKMKNAKLPNRPGDMWLLADSAFATYMFSTARFTSTEFRNVLSQLGTDIPTQLVASVLGAGVVEFPGLGMSPVAGEGKEAGTVVATTTTMYLYHKLAACFGIAKEPDVRIEYNSDKKINEVVAEACMGADAGRDGTMVKIYVTLPGNPFGLTLP